MVAYFLFPGLIAIVLVIVIIEAVSKKKKRGSNK